MAEHFTYEVKPQEPIQALDIPDFDQSLNWTFHQENLSIVMALPCLKDFDFNWNQKLAFDVLKWQSIKILCPHTFENFMFFMQVIRV